MSVTNESKQGTDDSAEQGRGEMPAVDVPVEAQLPAVSVEEAGEAASNELEKEAVVEEEVAEWADEDDLAALDQEYEESSGGRVEDVAPLEELSDEEAKEVPDSESLPMDWYILKVQSNREASISDALRRRVKVAGLDDSFDQIIVPVEMVTEFKGGKKKIVKRKLYPGYIVVHMIINDITWFLVRETPGIGDFTGSVGRPTPMSPNEVARIIPKDDDVESDEPKLQIGVDLGERVKITDGTFDNFEGEVDQIDRTNGRVTVMINIFGRSTPVELEYWQIEKL